MLVRERTMARRFICRPRRGRCSEMRMPDTVVSMAVVPGFVVLAVLSAVVLRLSLRWTRTREHPVPEPSEPAAAPRPRS